MIFKNDFYDTLQKFGRLPKQATREILEVMNEKYKFDENLNAEKSLREDFFYKTLKIEQEL